MSYLIDSQFCAVQVRNQQDILSFMFEQAGFFSKQDINAAVSLLAQSMSFSQRMMRSGSRAELKWVSEV